MKLLLEKRAMMKTLTCLDKPPSKIKKTKKSNGPMMKKKRDWPLLKLKKIAKKKRNSLIKKLMRRSKPKRNLLLLKKERNKKKLPKRRDLIKRKRKMPQLSQQPLKWSINKPNLLIHLVTHI